MFVPQFCSFAYKQTRPLVSPPYVTSAKLFVTSRKLCLPIIPYLCAR